MSPSPKCCIVPFRAFFVSLKLDSNIVEWKWSYRALRYGVLNIHSYQFDLPALQWKNPQSTRWGVISSSRFAVPKQQKKEPKIDLLTCAIDGAGGIGWTVPVLRTNLV